MNRKTYSRCVFLSFALLNALLEIAQKKILDHSVYDSWKSISNINVTNDGKYTAIVVKEQEEDDYLLVKNLKTQKDLAVPRGYAYSVTPDQKYIVVQIKAPFAVTRQAKMKKTAEKKMPKDSLAIVSLDNFSVLKIPNVKSYKLGKDFFAITAGKKDHYNSMIGSGGGFGMLFKKPATWCLLRADRYPLK